jgi:hypothetical protein
MRSGGLWFKASPGKKFTRPYLKRKGWAWRYASVIPATRESIKRKLVFQGGPGKKRQPISKIARGKKRTGGVAHIVKCLP